MTADISVRVVTGQTLDMPVLGHVAIWAAENNGTAVPIPVPADGQLKYQAPISLPGEVPAAHLSQLADAQRQSRRRDTSKKRLLADRPTWTQKRPTAFPAHHA